MSERAGDSESSRSSADDTHGEIGAELERLAEVLASVRSQEAAAEKELAGAMLRGFESGMTWSQIAIHVAAAGIPSAYAARHQALKVKSSAQVAQDSGSVSVGEAAKRLGVDRKTVYRRIERGELQATVDGRGRTMVHLIE